MIPLLQYCAGKSGRGSLILLLGLVLSGIGQIHTCSAAEETSNGKLSTQQAGRLFHAEIRPLLQAKCAGCHGNDPKDLKGDLDIRNRQGLLKGGVSEEPALVPGQPGESLLFQAITWQDETLQMPPKERNRLSNEKVELVRQWILAGAPWPKKPSESRKSEKNQAEWNNDGEKEGVTVLTSGGQSAEWTNRKYQPEDLWAYRPIQRPEVPWESLSSKTDRHPIDAFIQRKLQEKDLKSAPRAEKQTLLCRATLDLTGLPPTSQEMDAFLKVDSPRAFEKVIDRLLESPRYGEQMARHWLDVVRYADTSGFSNDYERPNAWRYRDYVIRSFNQDKPYDRFVIEQLAGDELDPDNPENLIAVGFLRMGPWEHTGMSVRAVTRQQFLDDVTNSVGVTFLAQGLRCARCHDHKFDPLPTRDYYRMQAVFAPVQFADRKVPYQSWENTSDFEERKKRTQRQMQEAQNVLQNIRKKHNRAVQALLKERGVDKVKDLPEDERPKRHYGLTPLEMSLQKVYRKRRAYYQRELKRYEPYAFSVYNGPSNNYSSNRPVNPLPKPKQRQGEIQVVHILSGGSLESPQEKVTPGVLSAVANSNDQISPTAWNTIPSSKEGRRLALARWIASPRNPLTARVIVNRVWQWHFGKGIVATPNNFGKMGAKPTHPELLDWLAVWFVEHDWSIKKLHRLIMTSSTYQQSSTHPQIPQLQEVDSQNQLLAYFPPRRLAAEEIRDSMLAATGELNTEMGGPGIYPQINWEVALQPRHIMGSVAPAYQPSPTPEQRNRRTIYAFRYRTLPDPMLKVFDRPGSETSCERRDETTVTPQAFALFNGKFAHNRALALAHRLNQKYDDTARQTEAAFYRVYGRAPTSSELKKCRDHISRMTQHHRRHEPEATSLPKTVERQMVEELTGESFTWEEELPVMENYQRDLQPWEVDAETRALAELCLVLFNSNEFLYIR